MYLKSTAITPSPNSPGRVRLVGNVTYESLGGRGDRYWIEVDERFADDLSESGNPWVALLLPLAVTLDEPLRLAAPVDPRLLEGAGEAMRTWNRWYPRLRPVPIHAESADGEPPPGQRRRAAFYSGGIDSLHTVLQDIDESGARGEAPVSDLLLVFGFDFARTRRTALEAVRDTAERAAARLGRELVVIESNLRETRFRHADFMDLAYGATLAGFALALEGRYSEVLISAGFSTDTGFPPHGSHPETDPRFSTTGTRIVHYGGEVGRVEKTRRVARSELTRDLIRVCWYPSEAGNCGRCPKCLRTKIALDLLGELDGCPSFPDGALDLEQVSRFRARHDAEDAFLRENRDRAREAGRPELVEAIETAMANCGRFRHLLRRSTAVGGWLRSHPVFWDAAGERFGTAFGKLVRAVTDTRG